MSILLKKMGEYDNAVVATKKMLQLAWVCQDQNFEFKAFELLSLNYFYKQDVEKA